MKEVLELSDGEKVIRELRNNVVQVGARGRFILTNRRVMMIERNLVGSKSGTASFNLEDLDSIRVRNSGPVGCLILGMLLLVGGVTVQFLLRSDQLGGFSTLWVLAGGASVFVVVLLAFLLRRRKIVEIHSVRTTLSLIARPPFFGEVTRLVQEIQRAKQDRLDNIAGKPASSTDEVAQPQRTAQERLRELDSLRQDDLVSEAEYLAKRQRILDEL